MPRVTLSAGILLRAMPIAQRKSKGGNRYAIKVQRKQKKRKLPFPVDIRTEPGGDKRIRLAQVIIGQIVGQIVIQQIEFEQIDFEQVVKQIRVEPFTFRRSIQKPQRLGTFYVARNLFAQRQHAQKFGGQQTVDGS